MPAITTQEIGMSSRRVLAIGLDGYDPAVADIFIAEGKLPALAALKRNSAWFHLEHGPARRTGLAWEHVASGHNPDTAQKWSAVDFDKKTYKAVQKVTSQTPFSAALPNTRTVVFDPPYFDLAKSPGARGVVSWGAHDPGVARTSRPEGLFDEIVGKFGPYAAPDWIYGFVWNSEKRANAMADDCTRAVSQRSEIIHWLLQTRLPDWDLAIVTFSEFHSALEAMWHGIDPNHPLHGLPSAGPARRGIEGVYREADRFLTSAIAAYPDAAIVIFNLHGMGPNTADVPSMALLPEMMFRHAFGRNLMGTRAWRTLPGGIPLLDEDEIWSRAVGHLFPATSSRFTRRIGRAFKRIGKAIAGDASEDLSLDWMPASRYAPYWPEMRAFALPSYYDAQIRVNLQGREARGKVAMKDYDALCAEIESLLRALTDPITGDTAVATIDRTRKPPLTLQSSEADLIVTWRQNVLGLSHPTLGTAGPLPHSRTGGHWGGHGAVYVTGAGSPGYHGVRSSFDVVPTIFDLLGARPPSSISGQSLLRAAS